MTEEEAEGGWARPYCARQGQARGPCSGWSILQDRGGGAASCHRRPRPKRRAEDAAACTDGGGQRKQAEWAGRAGGLSAPAPPWAPLTSSDECTPGPTLLPPPCSSRCRASHCRLDSRRGFPFLPAPSAPSRAPSEGAKALRGWRRWSRRWPLASFCLSLSHCTAAILVSPLTGGAGSPSQRRHGPPAST